MEAQTMESTKLTTAASAVTANLDTILLQGTSDASGSFSVPHSFVVGVNPGAGYRIRAISVIVQHQNGNWHTLEQSNTVDNRFWITPNAIQGRISSPLFANRRVEIVVFAQYIVG